MPPAGGSHGASTGDLAGELSYFVRRRRLGQVFVAETGFIVERNPDTVRAPDCAFVCAARLPGPIPEGYLPIVPDLAVETVSPGDRSALVGDKVRMWLEAGVKLVWVVSPERRTITIHRKGCPPRVLRRGDVLDGEDIAPGFRLALADLWE